ncbi:MAG: putative manganese transporter [Candidatus Cloacimonadia bacterium]
MTVIEVLRHALIVTGFVFTMMLLIEYINVQTHGKMENLLKRKRLSQYIIASFLGAIPGCLGAFMVVTFYLHRIVSFGALVATMIATSGDEAFVMFAMFPGKALIITVVLFGLGILAGIITDKIVPSNLLKKEFIENKLPLHEEESCICFQKGTIFPQLKHCSFQRALLLFMLILLMLGFSTGYIGPNEWNWIRVTLVITVSIALFIVFTVPEHFLDKHLWEHIVKVHLPRIFLWVFGVLLVLHFVLEPLNIEQWITGNQLVVLLIACLIGLIPESGPHLIFVTLFAQGMIPGSILLASSIVQDGHGMLPLLAESKRGFVYVKAINLIVGLVIGFIGYMTGW